MLDSNWLHKFYGDLRIAKADGAGGVSILASFSVTSRPGLYVKGILFNTKILAENSGTSLSK